MAFPFTVKTAERTDKGPPITFEVAPYQGFMAIYQNGLGDMVAF